MGLRERVLYIQQPTGGGKCTAADVLCRAALPAGIERSIRYGVRLFGGRPLYRLVSGCFVFLRRATATVRPAP